jgi:DNA mismatch endonuclease Vsr
MDVLTKKQRAYCMSQIRDKDTKPELLLRKLVSCAGIKGYRLNSNSIAGRPDMWFPRLRVAIFIDGCFWHGCSQCYIKPKNNADFWRRKKLINRKRDTVVTKLLQKNNIRVIRFWEHQICKTPISCFMLIIQTISVAARKQERQNQKRS